VGIDLAPTGIAYSRPPVSPLGDSRRWPDAGSPFAMLVQHGASEASLSERLRWPLSPMIGTLACAPDWEAPATSTGQGSFGGNLDVQDMAPGATVVLNSYHAGALLFAGDVHGCQGDGEYIGIADESRSVVQLRATPQDGEPLPAPRVITADRIVALGIDKPLEAAAHAAIVHLMSWLVDEHGFSGREAYLTIGLHSEFRLRVYQMTAAHGLRYVVGASVPRSFVEA
jgi:acetamidase/formamidase